MNESLEAAESRPLVTAINKGKTWRIIGLAVLACSVIGGSSIGAVANFIPVETSFAKNAWRSGIVTTIFIIPAIVEFFYRRNEVNYWGLFTLKEYSFLVLTLLCQVLCKEVIEVLFIDNLIWRFLLVALGQEVSPLAR